VQDGEPATSPNDCASGAGLAGALWLLITMQAFTARPPPLVADDDGVIRISGTRVQLETIVLAFDAGATAEEITQQYTSVELADVYAVILICSATKPRCGITLRRGWIQPKPCAP